MRILCNIPLNPLDPLQPRSHVAGVQCHQSTPQARRTRHFQTVGSTRMRKGLVEEKQHLTSSGPLLQAESTCCYPLALETSRHKVSLKSTVLFDPRKVKSTFQVKTCAIGNTVDPWQSYRRLSDEFSKKGVSSVCIHRQIHHQPIYTAPSISRLNHQGLLLLFSTHFTNSIISGFILLNPPRSVPNSSA